LPVSLLARHYPQFFDYAAQPNTSSYRLRLLTPICSRNWANFAERSTRMFQNAKSIEPAIHVVVINTAKLSASQTAKELIRQLSDISVHPA
jgi:hypothetical protein